MGEPERSGASDAPSTVREAKRVLVSPDYEGSFDDLVLEIQLEHELAGFETIATTRIDELVAGQLEEDVARTAMIMVCHAEIAAEAIEFDQEMAGLFPCATIVYESEADGRWYVYHVSVMSATRDLGFFPGDTDTVDELVEMTGDRMGAVWDEIESRFGTAVDGPP